MAEHFVAQAAEAIQRHGNFTVAISGGSTPRASFQLLAGQPYAGQVDWAKTHVFWVDERSVPPDYPDSNYRMACDLLLDKVPLPEENIHRMRGERPAQQAAAEYDELLRQFFRAGSPAEYTGELFDLAWMGMGPDGHTASLFPGSPALEIEDRWVTSVEHHSPPPPMVDRVTLTRPALRRVHQMTFLISGPDKAQALEHILQPDQGNQTPKLPAALVWPDSGNVLWLLDTPATAQFSESNR